MKIIPPSLCMIPGLAHNRLLTEVLLPFFFFFDSFSRPPSLPLLPLTEMPAQAQALVDNDILSLD